LLVFTLFTVSAVLERVAGIRRSYCYAQRKGSFWIEGKEETKASSATPDESLYGGFWRLKGVLFCWVCEMGR